MARQTRKEVRDSLLEAMKMKGMESPYFLDLLEDYMDLWDMKRILRIDIKKRGPIIEWQNGANQKGLRKNDSVVEYPKISKRMTDILRQLGIDSPVISKTPYEKGDDDDASGEEDIGL